MSSYLKNKLIIINPTSWMIRIWFTQIGLFFSSLILIRVNSKKGTQFKIQPKSIIFGT